MHSVSSKDPKNMSAAAINKELDALSEMSSKNTSEFIAAGRGRETANETWEKSDPLALRYKAIHSRIRDLSDEVTRRAGPGMRRLPRGFGPMKNPKRRKQNPAARRYYVIENYQGSKISQHRETAELSEAIRYAKQTPHSSIAQMTADGWLVHYEVFSPKHPITDKSEKELRELFIRKATQKGYSTWLDNPRTRKQKVARKKVRAKTRATVRYKITAQNKGKKMHFDGRNFSERPAVKSFALVEDAKQTAIALIRRYPILRKYRVRVESFP